MNGHAVKLDLDPDTSSQPDMPSRTGPTTAAITTATTGRFVVTSVGLDVPLDTMRETDGTIVPPGFTVAYCITNRGVGLDHAADGTVYVAIHSLRNGGVAPGNYLFDQADGTAKINPGDAIGIAGAVYTVDDVTLIPKPDLPGTADLWVDIPGRLVVITCLQKPDDAPSEDNFVIVAHLT